MRNGMEWTLVHLTTDRTKGFFAEVGFQLVPSSLKGELAQCKEVADHMALESLG